NGGQPSNYNAGFAASKGEIICFLDSDDLFVADKLEKVVNVFKSSEEIGWCFHSLKLIDVNGNTLTKTTTRNYQSRKYDLRARLKAGKIPPSLPSSSALCFKRSLLEKILPMPTNKLIPASDFYLKYIAVALSIGFILGEDLILQKIHDNNMATLRKDKLHMKAREQLFTGYWIRQEFPYLRNFADKLIAVGTGFNWCAGNNDFENSKIINSYLSSISFLERSKINFIALYYYLKKIKY
ncbi:MAG: glycosyltransferase, partial [Rivularia sp. (in: cyanobacteria)]